MFCKCIDRSCAPGYLVVGKLYRWFWYNTEETMAQVCLIWPEPQLMFDRNEFLTHFKILDYRKDATDYRMVLTCKCKRRIYSWLPNFIYGRTYQCHISSNYANVLVFPDGDTNIPISLSDKDFMKNFDLLERCPEDLYGD